MTKLQKEKEDYNEPANQPIEEILNSIKNVINCNTVNSLNNATYDTEDSNDILILTEVISSPNQINNINTNTIKNNLFNITTDRHNSESTKIESKVKKNISSQTQDISISKNKTIEDIVIELLKPKLSEWLDNNLSNLVKSVINPIIVQEIKQQLSKIDQSKSKNL
ncbi:hypothetical protein OCHUTO_0103 [Orientia chuto str. Dubai]|uniref:DUF2497 domain-containing protein n=1 Tax=Orientia chuto str. Dubai TaxID=1359168 RepID=A0A0F3MNK4_9RICK|nr:DUF2497 domain-containing protein [Candidatus Orientia mediorientalis]KJV57236.1 hypothetical protein OCHUTO_0103 [Orientia chuto str. Dubai]